MKQKLYLLAVAAASLMLFSFGPKKNSFEIKNGVNISHWLSQSDQRGESRKAWFTRADVEYIAHLGYDHIRIPIDEVQMFTEDGEKIPEAFALLHDALKWCNEFHLRAVVDLHILRSHYFNSEKKPLFTDVKEQEKFYEFWRKISGELKKYSIDKVAYEPMNEPVADDPETWNVIVNRCVEVIRKLEPRRTIVMGSNRWQNFSTLKDLRVPENDPNIILSFHYYEPFLLTHYKASWTYLKDITVPVHYPGQLIADADMDSAKNYAKDGKKIYNIDVIESNFMQAIEVAKKHNLKLYCGEYGCIAASPEADKIRWYKDLYTLFERHGIARANWEYKSDFGIIRNGKPQTEMANAILGK
ncbi:MAG: glycoside hydrolase family 5 protein [Chitinophagaceae bacterium]|nr:glycoside hydrolase family 5 protein [Chitinophagaceae bacterium]